MVVHSIIPTIGRLRKEDFSELEGIQGYIVRHRLKQTPHKQTKKTKSWQNGPRVIRKKDEE